MNSQKTVRLVIALLGATGLACIAGIIYLAAVDKVVPETLSLVVVACVAGVTGILSQTNAASVPSSPAEPVILAPEV